MSFQAIGIMICTLLGIVFISVVRKRYIPFILQNKSHMLLHLAAPFSLFLMDQMRWMERFPKLTSLFHQKAIMIYGVRAAALGRTKMEIANIISVTIMLIYLFMMMAVIDSENPLYLYLSLITIIICPLVMMRRLDAKIKRKRLRIIIELPEFMNKFNLLINAGETLQQALVRCVTQNQDHSNHPLYIELAKVTNDISSGISLQQALDELCKRCAIHEISYLSTTILMNYRRGGGEFVLALRELSGELWEKRKTMTRVQGEEASAKMVFPMMIIFLVLMMIIASPAVMLMN